MLRVLYQNILNNTIKHISRKHPPTLATTYPLGAAPGYYPFLFRVTLGCGRYVRPAHSLLSHVIPGRPVSLTRPCPYSKCILSSKDEFYSKFILSSIGLLPVSLQQMHFIFNVTGKGIGCSSSARQGNIIRKTITQGSIQKHRTKTMKLS